jgi:hypothetical protein
MQDLIILPGTLVLVAAHQNETNGKACTQSDLNTLRDAEDLPGYGGQELVTMLRPDYSFSGETGYYFNRHADLIVYRELNAKGLQTNPIVICSDSDPANINRPNSSYDYHALLMQNGMMDHTMVLDCNFVYMPTSNTLTSRSLFHHFLESGRDGSGWVVGNYFGDKHGESIGIGIDYSTIILYNTMNNGIQRDISIGAIAPNAKCYIRYNRFTNRGEGNIDVTGEYIGTGDNINIAYNEIVGLVKLWSTASINASHNYWTTGNPLSQIDDGRKHPGAGYGIILYQPEFSGNLDFIRNHSGTEDVDGDGKPDWMDILLGTNPDMNDMAFIDSRRWLLYR